MIASRKKLSMIASSLLLACSLALAGAALANSAQDGHNRADSAWGRTVVAEDGVTAEEPPAVTPEAPLKTAADSAWG